MIRYIPLLLGLALSLTACGSGDDNKSEKKEAETAATTVEGSDQGALSFAVKANVQLAQRAMESCAASAISGKFTDDEGKVVCDQETVAQDEPDLAKPIADGDLMVINQGADGYRIEGIDDSDSTEGTVTFKLTRTVGGGVAKACVPAGHAACTNGTW